MNSGTSLLFFLREHPEILLDLEDLNKFAFKSAHLSNGYLTLTINKKDVKLHRLVMNASQDMYVDHINGNILDNRKENLRICTMQQNNCNTKLRSNNSSGYKGVSYNKENRKWRAYIAVHGSTHYLGYYKTAKEAAERYNKAAPIYHGEFAQLNIIEEI